MDGEYPYYGASGVIDYVDDYLFEGEYLLVAEDGANLLSRSTPIAFRASGKFWVNNHAHVLGPRDVAALKFLEIAFNAMDLRFFVTGSAQPKLTQAALNRLPIHLPPITEQHRIVAEVERRLSVVEQMEASIAAGLKRAERLRQAILHKAFTGQLVPQDPNDEPASVLLERIRAERAKTNPPKQTKRRGSTDGRQLKLV
jgi:type I restriction enzyme S subunit